VKVVILAGGLGTRLREETEYRPKPLVEVGGRPLIWHVMKTFAHHGQKEFVICLGYRGNMIKEYFLTYEAMTNDFTIGLGAQHQITYHGLHDEQDFQVTLADTGIDTMTGGRVKRIQRFVTDDTFLVTYGDGVADVDVRGLIAFHRAHGRMATVTTVRPISRFGVLDLDAEGRVLRFAEKPTLDGWTSAGFFVFNREVFELLDDDACVLERGPLEHLARAGELVAYRHDGFFFAVDTYREYKHLNELWAAGEAKWKVWR
jgi:glucose-1-phosphate cytidylyltransferase